MSVTADALHVPPGMYLASDGASTTIWPRCLYPSAGDALLAAEAEADEWWDPVIHDHESGGFRVRLTWAVSDLYIDGYWDWGCEHRYSWEAVECWEVW